MEIVISKTAKESALPNESPSRTLSAGADGVICSPRGASAERDVGGKRVGLDVGLLTICDRYCYRLFRPVLFLQGIQKTCRYIACLADQVTHCAFLFLSQRMHPVYRDAQGRSAEFQELTQLLHD